MAANRDHSPCTPVAANNGSCVNCSRPDSFDDFVQCDGCDSWWHMRCAGVTSSIVNHPWKCVKCLPNDDVDSTHTSRSSQAAARLALKLKQLEEQHSIELRAIEAEKRALSLEKQMFQERCKLMEAHIETENKSTRSRVSTRTDQRRVREWIDRQEPGADKGETTDQQQEEANNFPKQGECSYDDSAEENAVRVRLETQLKEAMEGLALLDRRHQANPTKPNQQPKQKQQQQPDRRDENHRCAGAHKKFPLPIELSRVISADEVGLQQGNTIPVPPPVTQGKPLMFTNKNNICEDKNNLPQSTHCNEIFGSKQSAHPFAVTSPTHPGCSATFGFNAERNQINVAQGAANYPADDHCSASSNKLCNDVIGTNQIVPTSFPPGDPAM